MKLRHSVTILFSVSDRLELGCFFVYVVSCRQQQDPDGKMGEVLGREGCGRDG